MKEEENIKTEKSYSLAPTTIAEDMDIYSPVIKSIIEEKEENCDKLKNKNIAVMGSFGAGKSSVISTYFKNQDNVLYVSLGSYIEEKNEQEQYKIIYSLTTNATIVTEEIVDYLIDKKFSLKISIDGKKKVNDLNRISINGMSVHDQVVEKLDLLRKYEKESGKFVQVTNVITGNNYKSYYETLHYLAEDLNLKIIDSAIDMYYDWTDKEIDEVLQQIRLCMEYYKQSIKEKKYFGWNYFDLMLNALDKNQRFYSCGAGIISLYVNTDGSFFA